MRSSSPGMSWSSRWPQPNAFPPQRRGGAEETQDGRSGLAGNLPPLLCASAGGFLVRRTGSRWIVVRIGRRNDTSLPRLFPSLSHARYGNRARRPGCIRRSRHRRATQLPRSCGIVLLIAENLARLGSLSSRRPNHSPRNDMAKKKNKNTFEKRQRETDRMRKAQDKRERRLGSPAEPADPGSPEAPSTVQESE